MEDTERWVALLALKLDVFIPRLQFGQFFLEGCVQCLRLPEFWSELAQAIGDRNEMILLCDFRWIFRHCGCWSVSARSVQTYMMVRPDAVHSQSHRDRGIIKTPLGRDAVSLIHDACACTVDSPAGYLFIVRLMSREKEDPGFPASTAARCKIFTPGFFFP